jgi:hypothetical protein
VGREPISRGRRRTLGMKVGNRLRRHIATVIGRGQGDVTQDRFGVVNDY